MPYAEKVGKRLGRVGSKVIKEASKAAKDLARKGAEKANAAGKKVSEKAGEAATKSKEAIKKTGNKVGEVVDKSKEVSKKVGNKVSKMNEVTDDKIRKIAISTGAPPLILKTLEWSDDLFNGGKPPSIKGKIVEEGQKFIEKDLPKNIKKIREGAYKNSTSSNATQKTEQKKK